MTTMSSTRATMAMVAAILCFAISCRTATTETAVNDAGPGTEQGSAETTQTQRRNADDEEQLKNNVTVAAARLLEEYVTPAVCTYAPDYCTKHELHSSRGIQSYLATAGTLFAGVLGIMFTKIKILVIISLMTFVIGKMLLFYAFLKSDLYKVHKVHHPVPFVKYTKDKYYIKHTPSDHSISDVYIESEPLSTHHSPYSSHGHSHGGLSYYRR